KKKKHSFDMESFDPDEQLVMQVLQLKDAPAMIDDLTIRTSLSPGKLASLLLQLEFKGAIKSLPGKLFTLSK
ncbi:MAG: DNA-protecting protein DprA, partial [Flammeovirgaceae bacterium]|nr:DNA-protecting protein DprA [Flammeovirgaceae bacterium]